MNKNSVIFKLFLMIMSMLAGSCLWLLILTGFTPDEQDITWEPFRGAIVTFGILTGILLFMFLEYNNLHKLYQKAKSNRISNSKDFEKAIEAYPELKSNMHVITLLEQIQENEDDLANAKIRFNLSVENYNIAYNSFPGNILHKFRKLEEMEDIVSDEMLGI